MPISQRSLFFFAYRFFCVPCMRSTKRWKRNWTGTLPTQPWSPSTSLRSWPDWSPLREILNISLGHSGERELQYLQQRTDMQRGFERYSFFCHIKEGHIKEHSFCVTGVRTMLSDLEDVQCVPVTEQQIIFCTVAAY